MHFENAHFVHILCTFCGVSGQIMCGGGSVHKESGGDSNAVMLQVWAWAEVAGAGGCVCVRGRRREPLAHGFEGVSGQIMCGVCSGHKESRDISNTVMLQMCGHGQT